MSYPTDGEPRFTMNGELVITLGVVEGSGEPPLWRFLIRAPNGEPVSQMAGPRLLVLGALKAWVTLFDEESRP